MTSQPKGAADVLRAVWAAQGQSSADLDEECGPSKTCRNMKDVSFAAMAEEGTDLRTAWRERLQQEGKFSGAAGTVEDWKLDLPAERR